MTEKESAVQGGMDKSWVGEGDSYLKGLQKREVAYISFQLHCWELFRLTL